MDNRAELILKLQEKFNVEDVRTERTLYEKSVIDKQSSSRLVINQDYEESYESIEKLIHVLMSKNVSECTSNAKRLYIYKNRLQEKFSDVELEEILKEADSFVNTVIVSSDRLLFVNLQVEELVRKIESRFTT